MSVLLAGFLPAGRLTGCSFPLSLSQITGRYRPSFRMRKARYLPSGDHFRLWTCDLAARSLRFSAVCRSTIQMSASEGAM